MFTSYTVIIFNMLHLHLDIWENFALHGTERLWYHNITCMKKNLLQLDFALSKLSPHLLV